MNVLQGVKPLSAIVSQTGPKEDEKQENGVKTKLKAV